MRINEILSESPQYENDAEISILADIRELTNFYKNFDVYVNARGRKATELLARRLLESSYSADWLTKVVVAQSAKLQSVRKALEDKINSGV